MGARKFFGPGLADFIKKNFVPVAIPDGNSITIQTATGKVLGAPKPGWNSEIDKGWAEFKALSEEERKPKNVPEQTHFAIVRPPPPPGGLVSRVYIRGLERDRKGRLVADERQSRDYGGPQRDFLWLTLDDWHSLVPQNPEKGATYQVPAPLARRIFCNHLTGEIVTLARPWPADNLRAGVLTLTVEEVSQTDVRLRLDGFATLATNPDLPKAERRGEYRLLGYLNYAREKKTFDRFDIAAVGDYYHANETDYYVQAGQKKALTVGLVFELATPDSLGYGTIPWALFDGWGRPPGEKALQNYFGTNPYRASR